MTDRELLEFAAKAAGELTPSWYGNSAYMDGVLSRWNPITDDGDALRLAVKLGFRIEFWRSDNSVSIYKSKRTENSMCHEQCGGDPYAATRRAIVRAAASIVEQMK